MKYVEGKLFYLQQVLFGWWWLMKCLTYSYIIVMCLYERHGGLMASVLDSRSSDLGSGPGCG